MLFPQGILVRSEGKMPQSEFELGSIIPLTLASRSMRRLSQNLLDISYQKKIITYNKQNLK